MLEELRLANSYFKAHEIKDAIQVYSTIVNCFRSASISIGVSEEFRATYISSLLNRSSCYCQLKEFQLAIEDAMCAKILAPTDSRGNTRLILAYQGEGNQQGHTLAIEECKRGIMTNASNVALIPMLTRSELALGLTPTFADVSEDMPPSHGHSHQQEHGHSHGHSHQQEHGHSHQQEHGHSHGHSHQQERGHSHQQEHGHFHQQEHGHSHQQERGHSHEHSHQQEHGHFHQQEHGHSHSHGHSHQQEHGHCHQQEHGHSQLEGADDSDPNLFK